MKTHDRPLPFAAKNATLNEQGAACLQHGDPSKATAPVRGDANMPFQRDYGDSTPKDNPEQNETWQSIGALARALAEKSGGAK